MLNRQVVIICALVSAASCDLDFPPGFKFGAASAAYQVEGAWNVTDKGESIWDRYTHTHPEAIADGSNGDVACDSYHQYKTDIQLAVNLGLHFYRFSISWPRLLPTGLSNHISEDGSSYYSDLIDECLRNGIEPMVTIYHADLPQILQDMGGWINPLIVDWFGDYARVVYTLYGDRVKTWLTINEPIAVCEMTYQLRFVPFSLPDFEFGSNICSKHVMLAHARAWRIYDEEFKPLYNGRVSIANQIFWFEPDSPEEEELAEIAREDCFGRYLNPIYSADGGWPSSVEKLMAETSEKLGYSRSWLPPFTDEEIEFVKGTYDYFAINHYMSRGIRKARPGEEIGIWPVLGAPHLDAVLTDLPGSRKSSSWWLSIYPKGIRKLLAWMKDRYGDHEFFITENGLSTTDPGLEDDDRVLYYKEYLEQILLAINEDDINVTGYTAWTLIDNFEWMDGYTTKFGLHAVDFDDPQRTRTPRKSARYYKEVVRSHSLVDPATLH